MEEKRNLTLGHHVYKGTSKDMISKIISDVNQANKLFTKLNFKNDKFITIKNVVQIFTIGPKSLNTNDIDHEALGNFIATNALDLYIHSAYLINPFSTDEAKYRTSLHNVTRELTIAQKVKAKGVVFHLPKASLDTIKKKLTDIYKMIPDNVCFLVEAKAMKSSSLTHETPEKMNELCKIIDNINSLESKKKIAICLDTAHMFASGVKLSTYEDASSYFSQLKYPHLIKMIQFNDNEHPFGSGKDEHNVLCEGNIWKNYSPNKSGIRAVIEFALKYDIPVIFERDFAAADYEIVYNILASLSSSSSKTIND